MLTEWWMDIDPGMSRVIPFKVFSDFLNLKKICPKAFEARRFCNTVLGEKLEPDSEFLLS